MIGFGPGYLRFGRPEDSDLREPWECHRVSGILISHFCSVRNSRRAAGCLRELNGRISVLQAALGRGARGEGRGGSRTRPLGLDVD